jgi:hypothetical protein
VAGCSGSSFSAADRALQLAVAHAQTDHTTPDVSRTRTLRQTARVLDRLTRDGYMVFHDLAVPGSPANVDHLVIGPSGVFVIDSKQ